MIPNVDGHDVEAVDAAIARRAGGRRQADADLLQDGDRQGLAQQGRHRTTRTARRSGDKEVAATREAIGWAHPPFEIPARGLRRLGRARARRAARGASGTSASPRYAGAVPGARGASSGAAWRASCPRTGRAATRDLVAAVDAKAETIATRKASQNAIEGLATLLPEFVGGSADLTGSNLTLWSGSKGVAAQRRRQLHLLRRARVRHGAIINGIALHGGVHPLWRHLPHLLRLRAQRAAHGGADEGARDLRVHPRLDRPGRGRPDAPVGRACREPAPDPEHGRLAAVRHGGVGRGLDRGGRAPRRPDALLFSRQNLPFQKRAPASRSRRSRAAATCSPMRPARRRR